MKYGVTFPTTDIGHDVFAIRDYVQAAEELGYHHIRVLDHVVAVDPAAYPGRDFMGYVVDKPIHEPLTLIAYLVGITSTLNFVTSILILPQRQTALVAKQAAEIDFVSNGRFRLGVGVGWNDIEYQAMNARFNRRGKQLEEQIRVLRELWTKPAVNIESDSHRLKHVGINPAPGGSIPIWIGAGSPEKRVPAEPILRRIGRLADGYMPIFDPDEPGGEQALGKIGRYAIEAGRRPTDIGIEARIVMPGNGADSWRRQLDGWSAFRATHIGVAMGGEQYRTVKQHIDGLHEFRQVAGF